MKKKSNLVFRVDVPDFQSKKEILDSIKKILELTENKDFIKSFHTYHNDGLEVEIKNAKADTGAVIHKRRGTGNVGNWYATMPVETLIELLKKAGY